MTVMINSPPISGRFDVVPSTGFEFDTKYKMYTSQWYDDDLPLQYSFGFIAPTGSLILFAKKQMSNSIALLPAGQDSADFELSCQMRVFDSYDAYSSLNKTVNVKKHQLSNSDYKKIGKRKSIFVKLINFFTFFALLSFFHSFTHSFIHSFILFFLFTYELSYYLLFLMPYSSPHFYTSAICRLRK